MWQHKNKRHSNKTNFQNFGNSNLRPVHRQGQVGSKFSMEPKNIWIFLTGKGSITWVVHGIQEPISRIYHFSSIIICLELLIISSVNRIYQLYELRNTFYWAQNKTKRFLCWIPWTIFSLQTIALTLSHSLWINF